MSCPSCSTDQGSPAMARSHATSWHAADQGSIDHHAMQPGRHLSVASIAAGLPERRDIGILQGVGRVLGIPHDPEGMVQKRSWCRVTRVAKASGSPAMCARNSSASGTALPSVSPSIKPLPRPRRCRRDSYVKQSRSISTSRFDLICAAVGVERLMPLQPGHIRR
jgi:hypothetical protein